MGNDHGTVDRLWMSPGTHRNNRVCNHYNEIAWCKKDLILLAKLLITEQC
jgi:hypothetical protein